MSNHLSKSNSKDKRTHKSKQDDIELFNESHDSSHEINSKAEILIVALSIVVFIVALSFKSTGIIRFLSFLIPFFICGYEVIIDTFNKVLRGKILDESFLMTVSSVGAFILQEYPEAVAIMLFYRIGELLEGYAEKRSRDKISELSELRPDIAHIETIDGAADVNPTDVKIGNIILVKPGERIPLDGVIVKGNSSFNLSSLTGESVPVFASEGEKVYSGAINISSPIKVKVTSDYSESTASRILKLIEDAVNRKSKQENLVHRFSKIYTPVVVLAAVALAVVPSFITGQWEIWAKKALTLLVVSCPCALVISVPLAYFAGIGNAAQNGILIKGSNYLETLSNAKTYVFDKTGTITEGVFRIEKIVPVGLSKEVLIDFAAAAEKYSDHPLAVAIKNASDYKIVSQSIVTAYSEMPGSGVKANVNGAVVCVGNANYIKENCKDFAAPELEGTAVYISINARYRGCILLADKPKHGTFDTLEELRSTGAEKLVMLTGDVNSISRKVAKSLNFDMLRAELLPEDKVSAVEYLIKNSNKDSSVVFIGDGINDAPVIARADVGIAMGCFGSEAAIESADIVIMDDDIRKIVTAARISTFTVSIAKQNIYFSIGAKFAIILLGIFGISGLWMAVIGDVGILFFAVINSLRALFKKY